MPRHTGAYPWRRPWPQLKNISHLKYAQLCTLSLGRLKLKTRDRFKHSFRRARQVFQILVVCLESTYVTKNNECARQFVQKISVMDCHLIQPTPSRIKWVELSLRNITPRTLKNISIILNQHIIIVLLELYFLGTDICIQYSAI